MAVAFLFCQAGAGQSQATIIDASIYPGSVGDQLFVCAVSLPAGGGTCDARALPPTGIIPAMTINRSGVTILGPCGQYTVTGQILINAVRGLRWIGCGEDFSTAGTRFLWAGNATDPMFQLTASRGNVFEHFSIWASSAAPLAVGIGQSPGAGGAITNNAFRDLILQSNNAGGLGIGMRWYGVGGNNDASLVERVSVTNYTTAAFSIENGQSKAHLFLHSQCNGTTGSLYCITTALGAGAGSFTAINMLGDNNAIDFFLGAPDDVINIIGGDFENSGRLLSTVSATGTGWPVMVQGVRWGANKLNADNRMVIYHHRGPFNFMNNIVDSPPAGATPLIDLHPSNVLVGATAVGNLIFWGLGTVTSSSNPFTLNGVPGGPWSKMGNVITDSAANTFMIQ